jgi:hypothetical protein
MIVFFVKYNERYIVYFKFSRLVISEIKKIKDFKFNSSYKSWSIPNEFGEELAKNLSALNIEPIFDNTKENENNEITIDQSSLKQETFMNPPSKKLKNSYYDNDKIINVNRISEDAIELNIPIKKSVYNLIKNIHGADFRSNILNLKGEQYEEFKKICNLHNIKIVYY